MEATEKTHTFTGKGKIAIALVILAAGFGINMVLTKFGPKPQKAPQRIAELLTDLLDRLALRTGVMAVGLDSPVGVGGGRLSMAQRQKLGLDAEKLGIPTEASTLHRALGYQPSKPTRFRRNAAHPLPDDVVVALENQPIPGPDRLRWLTSLAGVGRQVTLRVIRGGRTFDLKVQLGELSREPERPGPDDFPGFP